MPSEARTNEHRSFFLPPPWPGASAEAVLGGEEARHAAAVMRVKIGDRIRVVDGGGIEAQAEVLAISSSALTVRLGEPRDSPAEEDLAGRIGLAWIRSPSRLDWAVEKATELGAVSVEIFGGAHSVGWQVDRARRKADRWRRLARAAMKQSGRARCPEVRVHGDLAQVLAAAERNRVFYADVGGKPLTRDMLRGAVAEETLLLVGPEGGWSAGELELLTGRGAVAVHLGPRRLRTETAAVTLCAGAAAARAAKA